MDEWILHMADINALYLVCPLLETRSFSVPLESIVLYALESPGVLWYPWHKLLLCGPSRKYLLG
jgi:hypothetical protein